MTKGKIIWPSFGENMRVLKWISDRVHGKAGAAQTFLGFMPRHKDIDWTGIQNFSPEQFDELMHIDKELWHSELESHDELFDRLNERMPRELELIRRC